VILHLDMPIMYQKNLFDIHIIVISVLPLSMWFNEDDDDDDDDNNNNNNRRKCFLKVNSTNFLFHHLLIRVGSTRYVELQI